jgi:hypothetical protein
MVSCVGVRTTCAQCTCPLTLQIEVEEGWFNKAWPTYGSAGGFLASDTAKICLLRTHFAGTN